MTTTSAQLDDILARAKALKTWDQSLLQELYAALVEPFQTIYGWTLAPYQPGVVTDNLYRLRPRDWVRSEQDLAPRADGSPGGSVASFAHWVSGGLVAESYSGMVHPSLAVAMLASTARLWADILRAAGR